MSADVSPSARVVTPTLFVLAAFTGAALIFFVQPMVAKLVLPLLGGSPAVWNTSMAFFQAALLAGYAYAHLLQRLPSVKAQALVHLTVLAVAALVLPLRVSGLMGEPSSDAPALWLLGVLALSIGAPFAAVSATAPLVQAWHARVFKGEGGEPYALYAASNLGSLIALLAYPIVVEPTVTLAGQRYGWSIAYGLFVLTMAALAVTAARAAPGSVRLAPRPESAGSVSWKTRLTWLALAAAPSSLMLGVTAHLSTDVASAPFLWVVPLALYLITFIIAFQTKPAIPPAWALIVQAVALPASAYLLPLGGGIPVQFFVHLSGFFFTALVCHQALVARRPDPAHLTQFYLWMSLGGVVGGAFNAFLAPVIFNTVIEYPLVLALAVLARPRGPGGKLSTWEVGVVVCGLVTAAAAVALMRNPPHQALTFDTYTMVKTMLAATMIAAVVVRRRWLAFFVLIAALTAGAHVAGQRSEVIASERSFFGVLRQSRTNNIRLGGEVRTLAHGTTLHGAQAQDPRFRCRPLVYYAPETPIGQVFIAKRKEKAAIEVAAVGLGTGAVAAYTRPGDRLTFYEIDPLVVRLASNPKAFSYTTECARGQIAYRVGDARLTLAREAPGSFDILLVDAFSSDAIPAHLLTQEAMATYLSLLKPDGVLVLHLSNRHLALAGPAEAAVKAAGGYALWQHHHEADNVPYLWESEEEALIAARSARALSTYRAMPGWQIPPLTRTRPWTDDYMNLVGAMVARWAEDD